MKKIIFALITFFIFTSIVNAESSFINQKGAVITSKEYQKLIDTGYDENVLQNMTDVQLQSTLNILEENNKIIVKNIYLKVEYQYDSAGNVIQSRETEISKETFESAEPDNNISPKSNYGYWETSYKQLSMALSRPSTNQYWNQCFLYWKKLPANYYVDIFAARYDNMILIPNLGYYANIEYRKNGNTVSIMEVSNSTHPELILKGSTSGILFALQMTNHPDHDDMRAYAEFFTSKANTSKTAATYVTYQHAQKRITTSEVMRYAKFSANGLGEVFTLGSLDSNYDNMQGIYMNTQELDDYYG